MKNWQTALDILADIARAADSYAKGQRSTDLLTGGITGELRGPGDRHVYPVPLPTPGRFVFQLSQPPACDFDLAVFDRHGRLLGGDASSDDLSSVTVENVDLCFILVFAHRGHGIYVLSRKS